MSGREAERAIIDGFVDAFINHTLNEADPVATLYISGAPGTGKTALVTSALDGIGNHDVVHVLGLNCMAMKSVDDLWTRLYDDFQLCVEARGRKRKVGRDAIASSLSSSQSKW
jgi:cell division control protein 6